MNIEAFNQLLRVLREVKESVRKRKSFDLNDWSSINLSGSGFELQAFATKDLTLIPHNCGCTACACGYAGLDSWFREQGFSTTVWGGITYKNEKHDVEEFAWDAVREFFNISFGDAHNLFSHDSYRKHLDPDSLEYAEPVPVEEVIKRVEEFIKCQPTQCV